MKQESFYEAIEDETIDVPATQDFSFLISRELHNYESHVKDITAEINIYIKTIKEDDNNLLNIQKDQKISASKTNGFFRRFERNQYNIWILQYLTSFLSKLPMEEDIEDDLADPFLQFKSFLLFNIKILSKDDVKHAIFRSLRERGTLDTSMKYYQWWVKNNSNEMLRLVQSANRPLIKGWRMLFTALQRLCMFWLSVKNQDLKSVRKGDVYMYLIAQILMKRLITKKAQKAHQYKS